jgi:uncharacterized membrane-anchored protein
MDNLAARTKKKKKKKKRRREPKKQKKKKKNKNKNKKGCLLQGDVLILSAITLFNIIILQRDMIIHVTVIMLLTK